LCQPEYVAALIMCLRAVEQNNPALLADVNPALVCFVTRDKFIHFVRRNKFGQSSGQKNFCYNYVKLPPNLNFWHKDGKLSKNYMRCTHFLPHLIYVNALLC